MKSKSLILTAMLTALPSVLLAQQNIQKAFDALLNENIVEIKNQHALERDPETGKKTSAESGISREPSTRTRKTPMNSGLETMRATTTIG